MQADAPSRPHAYRACRLIVLSGTGNTFRVASELATVASARGIPTSLHALREAAAAAPGTPGLLLGLLSPTHGFTAPWGVMRRAFALPRGHGAHAFVMATRGATPVGRWMCPGLEGTTTLLLGFILMLRGYRVRGLTAIDMPVNWLAVHPGVRSATANRMSARSLPKARAFMETLLAGRRRFRGWISLALGLLLARLSLAYLLMGRFFLAKLFFATTACTGCGQCARACPFGAIRMRGRTAPRPYWTFGCESCMRCMAYCPSRAIEVSHPLAIGFTWLTAGLVLAPQPTAWLGRALSAIPAPTRSILVGCVQYAACLAVLWLAYRLVWTLARVPFVNRLLACTTLTRLYRRYHEPSTPLAALEQPPNAPTAG